MSDITITVQEISGVEHHPDADRLDIIKILGTQCIVGCNDYLVGDKVIYFPPDMMIPENIAEELGVKKYLKYVHWNHEKVQSRVAACRLRGVPSYGFAIDCDQRLEVDTDVTVLYLGEKYEPVINSMVGVGGKKFNEYGLPEGKFHRYTNIQHFWRYPNVFESDEEVIITEKIHGCVYSQTRIRMADGTSKYIRDIQPGEFVAGISEGAIVPSKVFQVFQNGVSDGWLKINFTRQRCGRGNSFGSITCTPNHQFLVGDTYQDASSLGVGDRLSVLRSDWHLSHIQEQILLGKMLGDGSLSQKTSSANIIWGHVSEDLTEWTAKGLGDLCCNNRDSLVSGYGSLINRARTHNSVFIADKFESFIKDGRKIVPDWVANELTPLAIAFWYMDDGSLGHNSGQEDRANFAVCGFTEADCQVLIEGLQKYCITAIYYTSEEGYSRLRLNADDAEKLFLLIVPYIPESLQYKLPERYRGHTGWLPQTENSYKPDLVPQVITSITSLDIRWQRWDLETETHNYLPSNVVTHNSNSRIGVLFEDGVVFAAGSHRVRWRNCPMADRYWKPFTSHMMSLLNELRRECDDVIVFGEIYGSSVQDMNYGVMGDEGYRVFDISINGVYLDWIDVIDNCMKHGVLTVPLLYQGPWNCVSEILDKYASGRTHSGESTGKFKGREGIVIKSAKERLTFNIGGRMNASRAILKYVSADYLARKGAQDNA